MKRGVGIEAREANAVVFVCEIVNPMDYLGNVMVIVRFETGNVSSYVERAIADKGLSSVAQGIVLEQAGRRRGYTFSYAIIIAEAR